VKAFIVIAIGVTMLFIICAASIIADAIDRVME
jgi:hypothetical protein